MKKRYPYRSTQYFSGLLLLFAAGFYACSGKPQTKPGTAYSIDAAYTSVPPVIDGEIVSGEWDAATAIRVFDDSMRIPNEIGIKALWDADFLYLLFDAADSNLQAIQKERDHTQLSKDDIIEFLLDTQNDHDSCWDSNDIIYHINVFGQTKDDRGTAGCRSDASWNGLAKIAAKIHGTLNAAADIDTGYVVEVAVPWEEIGLKPVEGLVMGANFGGQSDGVFYDWVDAWPFRQPFKFGRLILIEKK